METAPETAAPAATAPAAPAQTETVAPATDVVAKAEPAVKVTSSADAQVTNTAWTEGMNDDLKNFVNSRGFKDPASVLESYRNLEKLRGVPLDRLLKVPESAEDPAWNEVYTKLGKPVNPDGYGFKVDQGGDSRFADWAKDKFFNLNLTKDQGTKLVEEFQKFTMEVEAQEQEAYTMAVQEQTQKLQKEWGAAYNQNVSRAQAAYRRFGLEDKAVTALEKAIGFDGVMKFMLNLGERIGEHGYVGGDSQGFGDNQILTPSAAKARIKDLKNDPDFISKYIKGDVDARRKMNRLHEMAAASD